MTISKCSGNPSGRGRTKIGERTPWVLIDSASSFSALSSKHLSWVSWGFTKLLEGKVTVLGGYCGCCHVHSPVLNFFLRPKGAAECTCLPGRPALSRAPAKAFIEAKRRPFTARAGLRYWLPAEYDGRRPCLCRKEDFIQAAAGFFAGGYGTGVGTASNNPPDDCGG